MYILPCGSSPAPRTFVAGRVVLTLFRSAARPSAKNWFSIPAALRYFPERRYSCGGGREGERETSASAREPVISHSLFHSLSHFLSLSFHSMAWPGSDRWALHHAVLLDGKSMELSVGSKAPYIQDKERSDMLPTPPANTR
jgi:hypothetical protein